MQYYLNTKGFLYTGDLQPGDRIPTPEEVTEYFRDKRTYSEKRASEYPDFKEYLDAQVKINSGDETLIAAGQTQLQEYINLCLKVKTKYPKE